jgi:pimeloyl-ACP methyl ester carboxylesterase
MADAVTRIVAVHGFLDSGEIWTPLMDALGAAFEWRTPDLAGMGALVSDQGPYALERYAADVVRLIDQTEGPRVLLGHSMGAQVAELAALARPGRILALVLVSPVPLAGVHAPPEAVAPLAATGGDVEAMRTARRGLMAQPVDEKVLTWLTDIGRAVRRPVTEALVATWNAGAPQGQGPSVYPGPVLVVSGEADVFVTPDMAKAVAGRFAHSHTALVQGAGHWPQAEQPKRLAAPIHEFLEHDMAPSDQTQAPGAHAVAEAGWTGAFSAQTEQSFADSFDANVEFEASVMARTAKGREQVKTIMGAASRLYETLEFTHRGKDGDHSFLEWEARMVGGEPVSGITILTSNDEGKIVRIAIHHRPLKAAIHFSEGLRKSLAGKIDADFFYGPELAAAEARPA